MATQKPKTQRCLCGETFVGYIALSQHKLRCEVLEAAVYDELDRIAELVGRVPTSRDYITHARDGMPSLSWITTKMGAWTELLVEIGICEEPASQCKEAAEPGERYKPTPLPKTDFADGLAVSSSRTVGNRVYYMLR